MADTHGFDLAGDVTRLAEALRSTLIALDEAATAIDNADAKDLISMLQSEIKVHGNAILDELPKYDADLLAEIAAIDAAASEQAPEEPDAPPKVSVADSEPAPAPAADPMLGAKLREGVLARYASDLLQPTSPLAAPKPTLEPEDFLSASLWLLSGNRSSPPARSANQPAAPASPAAPGSFESWIGYLRPEGDSTTSSQN